LIFTGFFSCPSDTSGVKIKVGAKFWWNYTDRGKPNYAIVVLLIMVWLRVEVSWDVMLYLCVSYFE